MFKILGPLEVFHGRVPVPIRGVKRRALLIALLTHSNEVVSVDRLVDWLWPDGPPKSAVGTLRAHVSALRRTLEPGRPPWAPSALLITRGQGYQINAGPADLDKLQFEELVRTGAQTLARGTATEARRLLQHALRLWRGPALADVAFLDAAQGEIGRLDEMLLTANVLRIEAELRLGLHLEVIPELTRLIVEHPLHERFHEQLMIALWRSGRRGDALAVYRKAHQTLARELNVVPSPSLRRLEAAILADDVTSSSGRT